MAARDDILFDKWKEMLLEAEKRMLKSCKVDDDAIDKVRQEVCEQYGHK